MLRFLLLLFGALGLLGGLRLLLRLLRRAEIRHVLVRGHPQTAAHTGDALGVAPENVVTTHCTILLSLLF